MENKFKTRTYTYSPLNTLKPDTRVDVYGVVKFHKLSVKTRGTDFMKIVTIVDKSLIETEKKLKCLLFSRNEESLPQVSIGSIVRFHRLQIKLHNGELQGMSGQGFSWLVIDGQTNGCMIPKSSNLNYTFTTVDKRKIEELLQLIQKNEQLRCENMVKTLEQLQEGIYFDFLCQVVAVSAVEENVCFLLQIWDGTQPCAPIYSVDTEEKNLLVVTDMELMEVAKNWLVDICVFNDHYEKAKTLKPGIFLKFFNLHCPKHKNMELADPLNHNELELVLHRGSSYGRGFKILSETDPEIKVLKKRLEIITKNTDRTLTSVNSGSKKFHFTKKPKRAIETVVQCSSSYKTSQTALSGKTKIFDDASVEIHTNCQFNIEDYIKDTTETVLSIVTAIQGHQSVRLSHFSDIINSTVPMKFRLLAKVLNYSPKLNNVSDFLSLFCPECHYLTALNNYKVEQSTFVIKNCVEYYRCPHCARKNTSEEIPVMEYIFLLKLILTDGLYYLVVNLWRDEAVKFFNNITPLEFIKDAEVVNKVSHYLETINSRNEDCEKLPLLECCIKSFNGQNSICYEMFDTVIAV